MEFPEDSIYKSKSESSYYYKDEGVYRKSNHWGRVGNCRWKLITDKYYKNQQTSIGFAKWVDFFRINATERIFYIDVDFEKKIAKIQPKKEATDHYLFTFSEAQKRTKQITHLFKEEQWSKYYKEPIAILRKKIITPFINSKENLQYIKTQVKESEG
jgi:hypothetical protein